MSPSSPTTCLAVLAGVFFVSACGGEADPSVCDQAREVVRQAVFAYCSGKEDQCWYCRCHNRDQVVAVQVEDGQSVYSCADPEPCKDDPDTPEDECGCEGQPELEAENCLENQEDCAAPGLAHARDACQGTPI